MSDYQIRYQTIFFSIYFICLIGVIFYVANEKVNAAVSRFISPYQLRVLGFTVLCGYTIFSKIGTYQNAEKQHTHLLNWHFHLAQVALFWFILGYPILIFNSGIKKQFAMAYKIAIIVLSVSLILYEVFNGNTRNIVVASVLLLMAVLIQFSLNKRKDEPESLDKT